jgi:hypothetical protein
MAEDKTTGGSTVEAENPAAPPPATKLPPVMDVVPPPSSESAASPGEAAVTEAPPEEEYLPIGEDIAKQIGADEASSSTEQLSPGPSNDSSATPATSPTEAPKDSPNDSPDELIKSEGVHEEPNAPPAAVSKAPKTANPARAAVFITVFVTLVLAGLAVFAYISSQN